MPNDGSKLSNSAHVMCGWPLILVGVGGALGGALGGGAYVINVAIYKSHLPAAAKVALNLVCGVVAFALYWVIARELRARM